MILKMRGGKVRGIVNVEAAAPRLHDVARKAETGLLGAFEMFGGSPQAAHGGQHKKRDEREHLSFARRGDGGPANNDREQNAADGDQRVQQ